MTETARPEPFFIADDHALDLLNSVATPWGTEIEWLGDGRDLLAWLEQAGCPATRLRCLQARLGHVAALRIEKPHRLWMGSKKPARLVSGLSVLGPHIRHPTSSAGGVKGSALP